MVLDYTMILMTHEHHDHGIRLSLTRLGHGCPSLARAGSSERDYCSPGIFSQ